MIYYLMYSFSIPPFRYLLLHSSTHPLIRVFIFIHTSYLITFNCLFVSYVICLHDIFVFVYLFKPPFDIFMYVFIGFSCAYYFIYSIINSCMHSLMYLILIYLHANVLSTVFAIVLFNTVVSTSPYNCLSTHYYTYSFI